MVLTLVIAEASIGLVPRAILNHPSVLKWAQRKRKNPGQLILDQNYHFAAMKEAHIDRQSGRPDITHLSLLAALGSPLNLDGGLRCIVHTRENRVIRVQPETRLPRNTDRFVSLLEQLYQEGKVPKNGASLMTLEDESLSEIVARLRPDSVTALTTKGTSASMTHVAEQLITVKTPILMIGGFSEGHFSNKARNLASETYSIDKRGLDAWVVVARAVYDYERVLKKRRTAPSRETMLM